MIRRGRKEQLVGTLRGPLEKSGLDLTILLPRLHERPVLVEAGGHEKQATLCRVLLRDYRLLSAFPLRGHFTSSPKIEHPKVLGFYFIFATPTMG